MDFSALTTTILGTKAEQILISEFARKMGYFPFIPGIDTSHPIDAICLSGASIWLLDIKCKSRRKYFFDTGMDRIDAIKYMGYPFPVYVLWADIVQKKVYGNWIKKLMPYSEIKDEYIYFPLDKMIPFRDLTEQEYIELKELERSSYY